MSYLEEMTKKNDEYLENFFTNFALDIRVTLSEIQEKIDYYEKTEDISSLHSYLLERQGNNVPVTGRSNSKTFESENSNGNRVSRKTRANNKTLLKIKEEKMSLGNNELTKDINIKQEILDMPPPSQLPPKKRGKQNNKNETSQSIRLTRSQVTKTETEIEINNISIKQEKKYSDVIVQNTPITVVELSDSEEETLCSGQEKSNYNTRVTRSIQSKKDKKKLSDENIKRQRSPSIPEIEKIKNKPKPSKRTKRNKSKENKSTESVYEDAINVVDKETIKDEIIPERLTFLKNKPLDSTQPKQLLDQTVVVANPKVMAGATTEMDLKDIMTDDESYENINPELLKPTVQKVNQIFSPYDCSPVKKKVEAFERLGAVSVTKSTKLKSQTVNKENINARIGTPVMHDKSKNASTLKINRFLPASSSTARKNVNTINNYVSGKSASALKASEAEYKERELRRREKETEAMRKKEALIQASIQEKKRKREEKQLKVQQQRELYERQKEEKLAKKQKEEAECKYLAAKKKEEEKKALTKQTEKMVVPPTSSSKKDILMKQGFLPIYMTEAAPFLPTKDCYDSDDENRNATKLHLPSWTRSTESKVAATITEYVDYSIQNKLFCCTEQTIDLCAVFALKSTRHKRTSSAIWTKPPRYTQVMDFVEENSDE